jgi:hypothetical protein
MATRRGCPCPVAGRSLRHPAFAHSMLTALRHPACAGQQRRLSWHGQPLTVAGIGEGGGDEEDVRLVVRTIPSRVASRNLRATEPFHEKHRIVRFFLGRPPPAGAALRILRSSLGRAGIGEGGGDEEDVRLVVRTIPSRVASRNLRATEPFHEKHRIVRFFLGRPPPAGAALRILRSSLGRAGIGEGGGDEEDVRLVVRTIPSRVASRNLRATEPFHEKHRIVRFFLGRPPPAGAALRILRSSLGRAGIGEGGGDEEDVRLVVRTIPSRVASRNLRATEPLPSRRRGGASPFDANTCATPLRRCCYGASSCVTIACSSRSSPWPVTALTAITSRPICPASASRIASASGSSALLTTTISGRLPNRSS